MARLMFFLTTVAVFLLMVSCDIYEDEEKDWVNDVTIHIVNHTICPLDIFLNGSDKGEIVPGDTIELEELGQGYFIIVAFPWNDEDHYCDTITTPELINGDQYIWDVNAMSPCAVCDPTPAPTIVPPTTPTPTPTI